MRPRGTPPPDLLAAPVPRSCGPYELLERLATGGLAEVFLACRGGELVVLKRVRPALARVATSRFLDEAQLLAMLDHPNIVKVRALEQIDRVWVLVLEYVYGTDLRALLAQRARPFSLDDAVGIVSRICAALHHAHEQTDAWGRPLEIVHRDVTPANVLVGHDGAVKLCDFGIAQRRDRPDAQPGSIQGTFAYLSPEQCLSDPLDRRSDVFALGTLLYELTTGQRPFTANGDYELLRKIVDEPAQPPSAHVAGYPDELARIAMRALAKDPHERYPSARAMKAELDTFARAYRLAAPDVARLVDTWSELRAEHRAPTCDPGATIT